MSSASTSVGERKSKPDGSQPPGASTSASNQRWAAPAIASRRRASPAAARASACGRASPSPNALLPWMP